MFVARDDARVLVDDLEREDDDRDLVAQLPLYDVCVQPAPLLLLLIILLLTHLVQLGQPQECPAKDDYEA